ncbi:MAG: L,D-transpeptidase [Deltaproteobacteria bacterium]|nr:L,D-transpeptidase [Deltaproteobacteria bacterium]
MPSPSAAGAHEVHRSKQQAVTTTHTQLICDSSGKVCAFAQAPVPSASHYSASKDNGTASKRNGAGSATPKAAPMTAAVFRQSPKTDANRRQLNEPGSSDRAAIDGAVVYDTLTSDDPFSWVVHAYKSQHRLEVYFKGHLYKTYHAVFGRSLESGAKLWEGDRRTPEGNYLIVGKHRSARFGWFLRLNYPNERDHERFEQSLAAHLIPASAQEGGQIGIHGTDSPYLNVAEVDWTTGCISVDNGDISELARLLPVGTLVIINP